MSFLFGFEFKESIYSPYPLVNIHKSTRFLLNDLTESLNMYSARNLEMSIRVSLKSRPSERFHWPEMSQIKAEISLHSNMKLNFH